MNKSKLIEAVAGSKGISFKKSEEIVNTIFDSMTGALMQGERIELRGFGSFVVALVVALLSSQSSIPGIIAAIEDDAPIRVNRQMIKQEALSPSLIKIGACLFEQWINRKFELQLLALE